MEQQPFVLTHKVARGENLTVIGRAHGYENPGPIWAWPGNKALFAGKDPNLIHPGWEIEIPFPAEALRKIIATGEHLIRGIMSDRAKLLLELEQDRSAIDSLLMKIDVANFLASIGAGLGMLAAQGARGGTMTGREALVWLAESRTANASAVTTMAIPSPDAPRRDLRYVIRHTLGPWNPSYWVTVVQALRTGDMDLWQYGSESVEREARERINDCVERDVARLSKRIERARAQLSEPCYQHRI